MHLDDGQRFHNRVSLLIADTTEGEFRDITFGFEYERYIDPHWGIGGFVDRFEGEFDSTMVAIAGFYHPEPAVGMTIAPGYQIEDGAENRLAVRLGMFYEFDISETIAIAPSIYTDFIEGGERSAVIGASLNLRF